ncbi:DUF4116 domain-containing protein [Endozoicomonas sp. ONNA2]|uniref:DUF4116 domain-containing protein n=1 Tax=Endozoicomonas sp. ONNA2 TaxID=2828741 RepID=UPI002147C8DE|nr:DUF4116 domain-containing protein [Endozoicomonas sp. ONNA2]
MSYPQNKPISDHLLIIAIEHFGVLQFYPEHRKTAELCELACRSDGSALEYVPETLKTAELCQIAVDNKAKAFKYIPEAVKTFEMCLTAAKGGECFKELPEFLTPAQRMEIYRAACHAGASVLPHLPGRFMTDDFLKSVCTSTQHRDTPLTFTIPYNLSSWVGGAKASELYSLALGLSPDALQYVPTDARKGAILRATESVERSSR